MHSSYLPDFNQHTAKTPPMNVYVSSLSSPNRHYKCRHFNTPHVISAHYLSANLSTQKIINVQKKVVSSTKNEKKKKKKIGALLLT